MTILTLLVKIDADLLQLFYFWLETFLSHWLEKCSQFKFKFLIIFRFFNWITQPLGDLRSVVWICISLVHQNNASVVLSVANNPTYRLVNCASCLLIVPVSPIDEGSLRTCLWFQCNHAVQVVFLQDYLGVIHLREWNPYYNDHSCGVIWKIKTFTDTAATNAHQDSSPLFVFINVAVVAIDNQLVLRRVGWLTINLFVLLNFS